MQNTINAEKKLNLKIQQEVLIESLKQQPIVIVIRLNKHHFNQPLERKLLFSNLEYLNSKKIKHIEIGWHPHPEWIELLQEINQTFPNFKVGAASINNDHALHSIIEIGLSYSMMPFWNKKLSLKAIQNNQLLIPGINKFSEFKEATSMGYQILKVFPASKLGINFINQLKSSHTSKSFFIAAGGIKVKDVQIWLSNGYGAIALGRYLFNKSKIDPSLETLLLKEL